MRITYKVIRDGNNKILDRFFTIERSNNSNAEYEKQENIYKHLSRKYYLCEEYGVLCVSYNDNKERGINETITEFKTNIKQMYKEGLELPSNKKENLHIRNDNTTVKETVCKNIKISKKIRRRNHQIVKACKLYNYMVKTMKEKDFATYDNSSINSHLIEHAPTYYYKSFAQYRNARNYYHFSKYHTKFFPLIV